MLGGRGKPGAAQPTVGFGGRAAFGDEVGACGGATEPWSGELKKNTFCCLQKKLPKYLLIFYMLNILTKHLHCVASFPQKIAKRWSTYATCVSPVQLLH